jgi:hypothetical protein
MNIEHAKTQTQTSTKTQTNTRTCSWTWTWTWRCTLSVSVSTTTIPTIYWDFRVTYNINSFIYTTIIHIPSTRRSHSSNILASVAHKTATIPPEIVMVTAFATHDAVRVR